MCAKELSTTTSWQEQGDEAWSRRGGLRSRYSGYPLKDGEMVVTILSQGSFSAGHQAITFEWAHNGADSAYRKFKTFHLYPVEGQSAAPGELGLTGSATSVVPGRVERVRSFRREPLSDGTAVVGTVAKSNEKGKAASDNEAASSFLTKNGRYRSWAVDFKTGFMAFEKAKVQWKFSSCTPKFNLVGMGGGMNCGTWVQSIASLAGIPSTSRAASLGFPIPKNEVESGAAIRSEGEMWVSRQA